MSRNLNLREPNGQFYQPVAEVAMKLWPATLFLPPWRLAFPAPSVLEFSPCCHLCFAPRSFCRSHHSPFPLATGLSGEATIGTVSRQIRRALLTAFLDGGLKPVWVSEQIDPIEQRWLGLASRCRLSQRRHCSQTGLPSSLTSESKSVTFRRNSFPGCRRRNESA